MTCNYVTQQQAVRQYCHSLSSRIATHPSKGQAAAAKTCTTVDAQDLVETAYQVMASMAAIRMLIHSNPGSAPAVRISIHPPLLCCRAGQGHVLAFPMLTSGAHLVLTHDCLHVLAKGPEFIFDCRGLRLCSSQTRQRPRQLLLQGVHLAAQRGDALLGMQQAAFSSSQLPGPRKSTADHKAAAGSLNSSLASPFLQATPASTRATDHQQAPAVPTGLIHQEAQGGSSNRRQLQWPATALPSTCPNSTASSHAQRHHVHCMLPSQTQLTWLRHPLLHALRPFPRLLPPPLLWQHPALC